VSEQIEPVDQLYFEVDLLNHLWEATEARSGKRLGGGASVPPIEAVHRLLTDFARTRASNFGDEVTLVPARGIGAPDRDDGEKEIAIIGLAQAAWLAGEFNGPQSEPRAEIAEILQRPAEEVGDGWNGMTHPRRDNSWVAPLHWLWTIGFWLFVLLTGLWFVTRRREIRPAGSNPHLHPKTDTDST
jgi:hypothetical protein